LGSGDAKKVGVGVAACDESGDVATCPAQPSAVDDRIASIGNDSQERFLTTRLH
jgi:hypothetical protein